jgi:hypothetical protein
MTLNLSGVTYVCKLKETTSSTLFKYSDYKSNTVVPAMPWTKLSNAL